MTKLSIVVLATLLATPAFADDTPVHPPDRSSRKDLVGALLVGLSSVSAVAATVTGGLAIGTEGGDGTFGKAAVGLAVGAAVTAAIGIPLLVSARNDEHRQTSMHLGLAPVVGSTGGGVQASLAMHF